MRKKISVFLCFLVVSVMTFAFVACGDNGTDTDRVPDPTDDVKLSINKTEITLVAGVSDKLEAEPDTKVDGVKVEWFTSDEKIAKVSLTGRVTAVAEGTATITAYYGNAKASCKVTVRSVTVTLDKTQAEIDFLTGSTLKLNASDNGDINDYDWSSSDTTVATVNSDGLVTAHKNGTAVITAAIGGASGLYGFGLNLHRNPYHGRAGEYYSDDPYLTGVIAGWSALGAQSKGLYVYNKHFVLNDQEKTRSSYSTWITEQALRQTHIRPFEIAIEIGDAMNVMTAFNRIGTYWSGVDYNLMTKCLRGELGMRGFAVTDWYSSSGMNMLNGILAGQDLPDGSASSKYASYGPDSGGYGFFAQAMRVSAQRILYTVANSNAMNFYGEGTYQITYDPEWWSVKDGIITTIDVLFIISCVFLAFTSGWVIFDKVRKRKG